MADIKDRAREYIAEHSEYSEVFGETFVAVDILTAMVDFAEQETKELEQKLETERNSRIALVNKIAELEAQIEQMKCCENCGWFYLQQHWRESKEINESRMFHCGTCGNKKNWKIKEIKEND